MRTILLFVMLCVMTGCQAARQPLQYLVTPMDNGSYLFYADPKTDWRVGNDMAAFKKELDALGESDKIQIKSWTITRTSHVQRDGYNFSQIAEQIMVFTEKKK